MAKFVGRAHKAVQEQQAAPVPSVDGMVLEISEAVAAYWKESFAYFVAAGTAAMTVTLMMMGLIVNAQTS